MRRLWALLPILVALSAIAFWWRVGEAAPAFRPASAVVTAPTADGPPQRSTLYDGTANGQITYPHDVRFERGAALTLEAWVYRWDDTRCEPIVNHGLGTSYWFGFCPKPRFHRSSGAFADATVTVPAYRWTHVAVSYDGATASFYVNGEAAGSAPLDFTGVVANDLIVGADAFGDYLQGNLDEVRIWSVARTQAQIQAGMYEELRSGDGLEAVFADGGMVETLQAISGTLGSGVKGETFGILPRDLVIPRAAITPTVDGLVDGLFEYAGAEQLTLRYVLTGTGFSTAHNSWNDRIAYLVRTESDLHIGIQSVALGASNWDQEPSWIGLMLDPLFTRDPLAQPTHARLRILLNSTDPGTSVWQVGDGAGNYVDCTDPACPQRGVDWEVGKALFGDDVGPRGQSIEIRIAKALLGEWTEIDGLAIGQFALGSPPRDYLSYAGALASSPATWPQVTYGEGSAQLPRAMIKGKVYAGSNASAPPLAGYTVQFGEINSAWYERTTDANGEFSFDVPVPAGALLRLQIPQCNFCRFAPATTSGPGQPAINAGELYLFFNGCTSGTCNYADAQFYVQQPLPAATITSKSPPVAMLLNGRTGATTPIPNFTIEGENLHDQLTIYISPYTQEPDPAKWTLYPVQVLSRSPDLRSVTVRMPTLTKTVRKLQPNGEVLNTLGIDWRWVVKDDWTRPGVDVWKGYGAFRLTPPEYPLLYGFGFDNEDQDASLDEFLAVYGDHAYVCIGAFGLCLTHVPDPLYWTIWYPVYKLWINSSGGSCVGMSATSLLLYQGRLRPETFDSQIYFPAGFTARDSSAKWDYSGALGKLTGPPTPGNLWAHIRRNHGVQTTAEFLYEAANQLNGFNGFPTQRLHTIAAGPHSFVASMMQSGGGHAVTPYATNGNRILVYDNNDPLTVGRYIEVDTNTDTYSFPRTSGDTWTGQGLFAIDIDTWPGDHKAPFDLPAIVMNLVFGDADALYTTPDGGKWGWEADGTFVDALPQAMPMFPMGAVSNTRTVPLMLPISATVPSIQVNSRGGDYLFYAGQGGNVLQMQVFDAPADKQDQIEVEYQAQALAGFDFTPQSQIDQVVPKIGMILGEQQRALFRWAGLSIPGGGEVGFTGLRAAKAADFTNNTGQATTHTLIVDAIDGVAEASGTRIFGPFTVPAGATHRTTIADWPVGSQLRSELDLDGDGVFEQSTLVTGRDCASEDLDENGLPDACEGAPSSNNTLYLPLVRN
jgi:hypothetical protein